MNEEKLAKEEGAVWPPPPSLPQPKSAPQEIGFERTWVLLLTSIGAGSAVGGLNVLTLYLSHMRVHWRDSFYLALMLSVGIFATYIWIRSMRRKYRSGNH